MAVCVACATFFATLSSVKYLATLIAHQHSAQLANKHTYEFTGHAEWHEVIDRAEENIEHHLPSWLHKDKAGGVGSSVHPGTNPTLPHEPFVVLFFPFLKFSFRSVFGGAWRLPFLKERAGEALGLRTPGSFLSQGQKNIPLIYQWYGLSATMAVSQWQYH